MESETEEKECGRVGQTTKVIEIIKKKFKKYHVPDTPPSCPSLTSSHSSSEASSSESSTSSDEPPSYLTGSNVGETMALSLPQKETKESLEEQDLRGGGPPCPDETSEWRSLNRAGTGDCLKSPKMGHWQHAEELEL